jgi:hypothetical protein
VKHLAKKKKQAKKKEEKKSRSEDMASKLLSSNAEMPGLASLDMEFDA